LFPRKFSPESASGFYCLQKEKVQRKIIFHIFLDYFPGTENETKEKIISCEEGFESVKFLNVDLQKVIETPTSETELIFYKW
jgi:hypothetical protein